MVYQTFKNNNDKQTNKKNLVLWSVVIMVFIYSQVPFQGLFISFKFDQIDCLLVCMFRNFCI